MKVESHVGNKYFAFLLSALFFTVFGAKVMVISSYGNVVPWWDQWAGEAALIHLPYMDGTLSISSLLGPHNEHRILFSRVLSLCLLLVSGEWSPILQMLVNAALHSVAVVLLTWALACALPDDDRLALVILSAITFAVPIGYENLLAGFQSAFYFLLLFAITSFILVIRSQALSLGWWCAIAAAVASYFSLASGMFTFFVAALVVAGQNITRKKFEIRGLLSVIILLAMGTVCFMFLTSPPGHEPLKAHSFSEFMTAFVWLAGFPFSTAMGLDQHTAVKVLFMVFALLPAFAMALAILSGRPVSQSAWFIAAIFAFLAVQILSVAYSRAQGFNAPRYSDILLLGIPTGFAAISLVVASRVVRAAWVFAAITSVVYIALTMSFPQVVVQKQMADQQLRNVKAFLATSDISTLQNKPFMHIPYPDPIGLASFLSAPLLRIILPVELRPTDQATQSLREKFFTHARLYGLVTRIKTWLLRSGDSIFAIGMAMLFVGLLWPLQAGRAIDERRYKQGAEEADGP
jgi:hypothetical protein